MCKLKMDLGTLFIIHGIGEQKPGYSKKWQDNINYYLVPNKLRFVEIYWQDIFSKKTLKKKSLEETELYDTLFRILSQRVLKEKFGAIHWIKDVILDFVNYLVDSELRNDIKNCLKVPLLKKNYEKPFSIIAHSWGTVISYDVLFDFDQDRIDFSLDKLFTFGSPLWLLKEADEILSVLHYKGAKKLNNINKWINSYAEGDPIGGTLKSFSIDKDFRVPSIPGITPHISYFVKKNKYVLKNTIAKSLNAGLLKKR